MFGKLMALPKKAVDFGVEDGLDFVAIVYDGYVSAQ